MNQEKTVLHNGAELDKVSLYDWVIVDEPGEPCMIHKSELLVDHQYQRERVSQERVHAFAREWSWRACACLIVAVRPSGEKFVVDGQHRKLAADKRSDIQELPCLLFRVMSVSDEAGAFVKINTHRGPVDSLSKFKALVVAGDDTAIAVNQMVTSSGYRVANGDSEFKVGCIALLMQYWKIDQRLCRRIWSLCVDIASGSAIRNTLVRSLYTLERKFVSLGEEHSVFDEKHSRRLVDSGQDQILRKCEEAKAYYGKGGSGVEAKGVLDLLNHRRRHKIEI